MSKTQKSRHHLESDQDVKGMEKSSPDLRSREFASHSSALPNSKAYHRHVKQYVQAPAHRFAAIVPPELGSLCRQELEELGFSELAMTEAGVEFSGNLSVCYRANLWLRTASRILCRLEPFRAGVAEELFYKVSEKRWELWLNPKLAVQVAAHVEYSRIEHEGVVTDTVERAIQRRFKAQGLTPPQIAGSPGENQGRRGGEEIPASLRQRLLVHLRNNHGEISLDTTGDHLHRRGYRLQHTGAPLRETLAAAILLKTGWRGDRPLVDGMCGSGTVAIEAALIARRIPAGLYRSFLFEQWPAFQPKTWDYMRRKARESILAHAPTPIVALDRDPSALAVAQTNAGHAEVGGDIQWSRRDFFDFEPQAHGLAPGLLVLNPPYGKRLSGGDRSFYERLGAHLRRCFEGWEAVILAPSRALAAGLGIQSMRVWTITHGGIPIAAAKVRL